MIKTRIKIPKAQRKCEMSISKRNGCKPARE